MTVTRPRHVLHVMNGPTGGAPLTTLGLIDGLASDGIRSSVVCHDAGTAEEQDAVREAVDGRATFTTLEWWNRKNRAPAWKRPALAARQLVRTGAGRRSTDVVATFAGRVGADLVHTNTILTPEGSRAARRLGLPHVWHVRELVGPGQPFRFWGEGPRLRRRLEEGADAVICNSHVAARCLGSVVGPLELRVVHNGIDVDAFGACTPRARPSPVVVGMVANVTTRWKRHDHFIRAAAAFDRALDARFRIYGHLPDAGDPYLRDLRDLASRTGVEDRLDWVGHVGDPVEVMADLDVLVHPATAESFGRIAVEAMAAGRPVVGVDSGGLAEIVRTGETGYLAPPDDPAELARRAEDLVRDERLRISLGAAGRAAARADFSLGTMTDGVVRVYESVLGTGTGRSAQADAIDR